MKIATQNSPHKDVHVEAERRARELTSACLPLGCKQLIRGIADKKQMREERRLAAFVREIAVIKAQCDVGMDAYISIAATCFISNRSHATVYRDIQKRILPTPTKIGRSSMLPFAAVKAYAAGTQLGGAA